MDFEKTYSETIALFTHRVAEMPKHTYLAPGDSAGEMVKRMKAYAKTAGLSLPAIHVLSHNESWKLYRNTANRSLDAKAVIKPFIEGRRPRRLFFLEDHYWDGEKIDDIVTNLVIDHAIVSYFTVMVGSDRRQLPLSNTDVFTTNQDLAYTLYHTYNRRKV